MPSRDQDYAEAGPSGLCRYQCKDSGEVDANVSRNVTRTTHRQPRILDRERKKVVCRVCTDCDAADESKPRSRSVAGTPYSRSRSEARQSRGRTRTPYSRRCCPGSPKARSLSRTTKSKRRTMTAPPREQPYAASEKYIVQKKRGKNLLFTVKANTTLAHELENPPVLMVKRTLDWPLIPVVMLERSRYIESYIDYYHRRLFNSFATASRKRPIDDSETPQTSRKIEEVDPSEKVSKKHNPAKESSLGKAPNSKKKPVIKIKLIEKKDKQSKRNSRIKKKKANSKTKTRKSKKTNKKNTTNTDNTANEINVAPKANDSPSLNPIVLLDTRDFVEPRPANTHRVGNIVDREKTTYEVRIPLALALPILENSEIGSNVGGSDSSRTPSVDPLIIQQRRKMVEDLANDFSENEEERPRREQKLREKQLLSREVPVTETTPEENHILETITLQLPTESSTSQGHSSSTSELENNQVVEEIIVETQILNVIENGADGETSTIYLILPSTGVIESLERDMVEKNDEITPLSAPYLILSPAEIFLNSEESVVENHAEITPQCDEGPSTSSGESMILPFAGEKKSPKIVILENVLLSSGYDKGPSTSSEKLLISPFGYDEEPPTSRPLISAFPCEDDPSTSPGGSLILPSAVGFEATDGIEVTDSLVDLLMGQMNVELDCTPELVVEEQPEIPEGQDGAEGAMVDELDQDPMALLQRRALAGDPALNPVVGLDREVYIEALNFHCTKRRCLHHHTPDFYL